MGGWKQIEGYLAAPAGFRVAAVAAGIKNVPGALDLGLVFSDARETTAAGVFTRNLVAAAPVVLSRRNLVESRGQLRALVVNSGNANACTGRAGMRIAERTARAAARLLGIRNEQVAVASTGVIGVPLAENLLLDNLPFLVSGLSREDSGAVARAIMTTDTFPKSVALEARIAGKPVRIGGVAKGAGMIHPRMATMLSFITTDAAVTPALLGRMLRDKADESFNRLTVDGDTSTNDTLIALASGLSGVRIERMNAAWFGEGLTLLCQTLARMIAQDGEGAQKLVTVEVHSARTFQDADRIARAIANSPLVKTAIAGSDPNWGRILCAAGYSGAQFNPGRIDVRVNGVYLCRRGVAARFDEAAAKRELDRKEVTLRLDLHQGKASARMWTCDLTRDYITINASYRT